MWHLQSPKPKCIAQCQRNRWSSWTTMVGAQVLKAANKGNIHTVNVRLYVTWCALERGPTRIEILGFRKGIRLKKLRFDRISKISRLTEAPNFPKQQNRHLVISTTEVSMLYLEFECIIVPLSKSNNSEGTYGPSRNGLCVYIIGIVKTGIQPVCCPGIYLDSTYWLIARCQKFVVANCQWSSKLLQNKQKTWRYQVSTAHLKSG